MSRGKHRQTDGGRAKSRAADQLRSWMSRATAAALLHFTEEQIQQMHGRDLHPERSADRSWRYSPDEIANLAFGGSADGAVAAKVFALFENNVSLQPDGPRVTA